MALALAPLVLAGLLVAAPASAATSVSAVMARATPSTPGAVASYPISYAPATSQSAGSTISVVAAPGTTFTACASSCPAYKIAQASSYKSYTKVSVQAVNGSSTPNEFVVTLAMTTIQSGTPVTIVAQGTNTATAGVKTLNIWTSKDPSPVSVNYSVGATSGGLVQGAIPQASTAPQFDLSSPAYLQSLFGTPTGTIPTLGTTYLSGSTWAQMDGATSGLSYLKQDYWSSPGYEVVLGVPILPSNNGAVSLQAGASQAYNKYFHQLALSLVNVGLGNAWLRLGWEFDNQGLFGSSKKWGTGNDPTQEGYFAEYFRQIVTTMRAVAGTNFKFIWNPDGFAFLGNSDPEYLKTGGISLAPAWPGSQYVDFIGSNVYDWEPSMASGYTQAQNWANFIGPQLLASQQFAASEGKPLVFPEWGVMTKGPVFAGLGDDPGYINGMYCFMTNPVNGVAWESYSNTSYSDWDTKITSSSFPASLAAYQRDFGQGAIAC